MSHPPTLEYQSPASARSEVRQSAVRMARANGIAFLVIGVIASLLWMLLFSGGWGRSPLTRGRENQVVVIVLGIYAVMYVLCGMVNLLGSRKIHVPNRGWEGALFLGNSIQLGMASFVTAAMTFAFVRAPHPADSWMALILVLLQVRILWRLGSTVGALRAARRS